MTLRSNGDRHQRGKWTKPVIPTACIAAVGVAAVVVRSLDEPLVVVLTAAFGWLGTRHRDG
ncbi:hypothetical protein KGA66_27645 [Actinocrinis puniceicyclus]|uniref:Uncharacterized protein n=1 Tax=Actinocrinis puniceicyclus TaxID=977794 RepID=A0A8J7WVW6_9ACTN|nr:hypothetical protein [Actinocrinis puniceicyclus]MBS2966840.1 hypothetical protein [Actinocrinis puniceicyclus]